MAVERKLRTLIVDDEPLAIERLQILCAQIEPIMLIGTATDGEAALRMIEALAPEVLLLDIAMPGLSGLQVAERLETLPNRPAVIFCTAYTEYAVAAFDVAAIDYLLKPVKPERLGKAIDRVLEMLGSDASVTAPSADWVEEFWVSHRGEMIRIATSHIDRIEAERDYMRLCVGPRSYLLHQTITELERKLDPERFIRLHRSTIVRRDLIAKLRHDGLGAWHAVLADGMEIKIGRTHLAAVKHLAGRSGQ